MILRGAAGFALFALFVPLLAAASAPVVASRVSPGVVLNVNVSLDNDGRVMFSVTRNGRPVIQPSQLGFLLTDAPKLDRNFTLGDTATHASDETWERRPGDSFRAGAALTAANHVQGRHAGTYWGNSQ